jgi:hypothetical protein
MLMRVSWTRWGQFVVDEEPELGVVDTLTSSVNGTDTPPTLKVAVLFVVTMPVTVPLAVIVGVMAVPLTAVAVTCRE